jgi:hypothetical protein
MEIEKTDRANRYDENNEQSVMFREGTLKFLNGIFTTEAEAYDRYWSKYHAYSFPFRISSKNRFMVAIYDQIDASCWKGKPSQDVILELRSLITRNY